MYIDPLGMARIFYLVWGLISHLPEFDNMTLGLTHSYSTLQLIQVLSADVQGSTICYEVWWSIIKPNTEVDLIRDAIDAKMMGFNTQVCGVPSKHEVRPMTFCKPKQYISEAYLTQKINHNLYIVAKAPIYIKGNVSQTEIN